MAMSQARKSFVTMLILAAVAAGVGAFAFYGVYKAEQADDKKNEESAKTFTFDKAKVKHITFTAKAMVIELEKSGEDWRIQSPVDARGDRAAVNAIIDKLADLKAKDL